MCRLVRGDVKRSRYFPFLLRQSSRDPAYCLHNGLSAVRARAVSSHAKLLSLFRAIDFYYARRIFVISPIIEDSRHFVRHDKSIVTF